MYQAIEAILRSGVIQPLEPVQFEENEHLVILRLSKPWPPQNKLLFAKDWRQFAGILKSSPSFNSDPLLIQQDLRNEWD